MRLLTILSLLIICIAAILAQRSLIRHYKKEINKLYTGKDHVLEYCLKRIMLDAVKEEDFEAAASCLRLLETLKKDSNAT